MQGYDRVYAKIDLDAIHHNMNSMEQRIAEGTKIIAVVKTDGYGHGAIEIAEELETDERIFGYATATPEEACILRRHKVRKPILVLGYSFEDDYEEMIWQEIRPAVFTWEMAEKISQIACHLRKTAPIHIKLDTGMSRIGYQITEEAADEIARIAKLPGIAMEGMFTHFAKADEADKQFTFDQMEQYEKMVHMLKVRGVDIPLHHCSNSAGIAEIPQANMDLVRAGITLYGLWPSDEVDKHSLDLHPVMELKSKVVHIKTLEAGRCISYGGTCVLDSTRKVATIPVGYGDGYPRSLSGKGYVLIHGQKAPILGRVCMDQFMVDVTDIRDVALLDEVTLFGKDGQACITMEELSELSGRFNYEFACDIGKRVPRVFYKNNAILKTRDYFSE